MHNLFITVFAYNMIDVLGKNSDQNSIPSKSRIMAGVSGGVDSAVTVALLQEKGYEVSGVFMRNWEDDDGTEECTSMRDWMDAQRVCDKLGVELTQVNFSQEYKEKVFAPFISALKQGWTPNPDILCNSNIKFSSLLDFARKNGVDYLATGHYARLRRQQGKALLSKAKDREKCQTYFLCQVKDFSRCLMPLGDKTKDEVRTYARKIGLHNHAKKDSTGICFIGERNFSVFISRYIQDRPGEIVDKRGRVLGMHRGLFHYTLGQRRGLGIGGNREYDESPWFVIAKNQQDNHLVVAQGKAEPDLYAKELTASAINWIGDKPDLPLKCSAKIRYRMQDVECEIREGETNDELKVVFTREQRSITAGQFVVFYVDELCLGGGMIL